MAITMTDAVIDFGHNTDRVTIKCTLDGPQPSDNTQDFYVRVIITDRRTNLPYDTGDQPPTVVRK